MKPRRVLAKDLGGFIQALGALLMARVALFGDAWDHLAALLKHLGGETPWSSQRTRPPPSLALHTPNEARVGDSPPVSGVADPIMPHNGSLLFDSPAEPVV